MHFSTLFLLVVLVAVSHATQVTWDPVYAPTSPITFSDIACSDGANGLATRFGVNLDTNVAQVLTPLLKKNVYYGGASEITGWNNPSCGKCFRIKYKATGKQIYFVALDVSPDGAGANVSPQAFSKLSPTGNTDPGRLEVVVYSAAQSDCFK